MFFSDDLILVIIFGTFIKCSFSNSANVICEMWLKAQVDLELSLLLSNYLYHVFTTFTVTCKCWLAGYFSTYVRW